MSQITINKEYQQNLVGDPYSALIAVIRPILYGLLFSLKQDVVSEVGGYQNVKLKMLPRLRRKGDGDIGICFEYAVHDAIRRRDPLITDKIHDALTNHCRVPGENIESILFGAEKTGAFSLIDTAHNILTEESRVLTGAQSQPPKLKFYLSKIAEAFRFRNLRSELPNSIKGLWKADLFLGYTDSQRWVGTTVKINPSALEGAEGLRIGIVPAQHGRSDSITYDSQRNLVVCPLPYDASFMEVFYHSWVIVSQFIDADANMPKEVNLPAPLHRLVAQQLSERREFGVLDVIEALTPLAQPYLLEPQRNNADIQQGVHIPMTTNALISPMPTKNQ
ncbi:hypothetical protein [Vibrio sp. 1180_3]|uniref:hypothetical protein n=1 Tax=Vibrio sp. 1180_3 TaxID=2528832 RepID=UPI002405648F|nr:hypothetical protein [Vibrio sp. 1180_3]MDF9401338.1 hypothetical protein [Vibrio sp. 1180_3]